MEYKVDRLCTLVSIDLSKIYMASVKDHSYFFPYVFLIHLRRIYKNLSAEKLELEHISILDQVTSNEEY